MFRFKLRTLLIATALVAVFLGLQVHVHMKAKRFVQTLQDPSDEMKARLVSDADTDPKRYKWGPSDQGFANLCPLNVYDVLLLRRRCEVHFAASGVEKIGNVTKELRSVYSLNCFGADCDSEIMEISVRRSL